MRGTGGRSSRAAFRRGRNHASSFRLVRFEQTFEIRARLVRTLQQRGFVVVERILRGEHLFVVLAEAPDAVGRGFRLETERLERTARDLEAREERFADRAIDAEI